MKQSLKTGLSFGLTSGTITTLGLMIGLNAGTGSKMVVLGGILTIAIADSFSDALGIHMSEESNKNHKHSEVWESTIATFLAKFLFTCTFIIPVLLFDLNTAIIISLTWGLLLLSFFSYYIGKKGPEPTWKVIFEHITIAVIVIVLTNYIGEFIGKTFN